MQRIVFVSCARVYKLALGPAEGSERLNVAEITSFLLRSEIDSVVEGLRPRVHLSICLSKYPAGIHLTTNPTAMLKANKKRNEKVRDELVSDGGGVS